MKRVWAAAVLFAAVTAASVIGPLFSAAVTGEMERQVAEIRQSVEQNDFASARAKEETLQRIWSSRSRALSAFMNHMELGEADTSLTALKTHLQYENKAWALVQCGNLKEIFQKLRKKEEPLPENIL